MNKYPINKYKILVDYYANATKFYEFNVWAFSERQVISLVSTYLNTDSKTLRSIAHITIYKLRITTFITKLFNKAPERSSCVLI
ncbi:MAG: hypothetical protein J6M39_06510 [Lachnospiraceae bacterium]|nr:hypothetical protein [Lachnospiraceae bacterium]